MRRRRLLWVNHFAVTPREGGGTRHFELARELAGRGWDVTVAASDFNLQTRAYARRAGPDRRDAIVERVDGVDFAWLWASPYERNDWRRGRNWLTFARSVRTWARTEQAFDVVIGSSPHLFAAWAALGVARRTRTPFVFEVRDLWPESLLAAGGRRGAFYHALNLIARRLYRRADAVVVLARGVADYLAGIGVPAERIAYVPNGVDLHAFRAPARSSGAGTFTLVYAGAHGAANGLDTVISAAEVLRGDAGIRFLLVGDGPAKAHLVASAKARGLTNVEFRSAVPKAEMPALLAGADAGLMVLRPSPLFAFAVSPNKLFDYLAAALPVVCNVPGDVAQMVREAGAGVQAEDASPDALARAIRALRAQDAGALAARGAAGRSWVEREHARPRLADRLEALLDGVARR